MSCKFSGKPKSKAKQEKPVEASKKATAAKDKESDSGKQKVKIVEPNKDVNPNEEDESSEGDFMLEDDDEDDSEDDFDDEDDSDDESDESDEETPKKVEPSKKRPAESASKTPVSDEKAKITPQKGDGKKGSGHVDTPYPKKQAGKTPANKPNQQTPKSEGSHSCKSCNKKFGSDKALESHSKAKHDGGKTTTSGIYYLKEEDNLKAQVEALTKKLKALETKDSQKPQQVARVESQDSCFICGGVDHLAQVCPRLGEMREVYEEQCNALGAYRKPFSPYSETYNPGWRNHPNFSWKSEGQAPRTYPAPQNNAHQNRNPLEDTLQAFIEAQSKTNQKVEAVITQIVEENKEIKNQIGKLTSALTIQERGKFASQPQSNPKGQHKVESSESHNIKDINAITTRSGKELTKERRKPKASSAQALKVAHDRHNIRKNFDPGKLRSRWTGPFVVKQVFPNGSVEVENPKDGRLFRVNGQRLKQIVERVDEREEIALAAPIYH
ncbi:hypothetical protein RD792_014207 [Penstemon davidsonii]|uniref:C2H2-type domain-containing protein n=1 Tax=Penstemon davidsonii TaxID=160366 RepID=A0ABR0CPI5_9LAMI|nr:hypothetical protein RD792_014207 [Penstemon davidsonii]